MPKLETNMNIDKSLVLKAVQKFGTPLWIYDEKTILEQINQIRRFDVIRFAQKSCSNIHILKLMRDNDVLIDSVSNGEIERSLVAGFNNNIQDEIIYTSDVLDDDVLKSVIENKIPVNIGSLDMIEKLGFTSPGHRVWIRVNPGFGHGHSEKTNTGGENSKHGIWFSDMEEAIRRIEECNLNLFGIHIHIGSGVDESHLTKVCGFMADLIKSLNVDVQAISAGGGLPVQYHSDDKAIDIDNYFQLWDEARRDLEAHLNHKITLEIEPGRFLVAKSGYLVSKVLSMKNTPKYNFVILDAGFNDLVRPSMYGSYHKINVVNKNDESKITGDFVIAGPLCESGDVFTQNSQSKLYTLNIKVPLINDLLVFSDAGAYGASMSSNYNSRPLSPEIIIKNNKITLIRRRQTMQELINLELDVS